MTNIDYPKFSLDTCFMIDTLQRQWNLLQLIPHHPRKLGTPELWQRLCNRGFKVTKRTVERDLENLSAGFPIYGDGRKPQGWCWSADAPLFDMPGMDPPTALAFTLAEQHLRPLLPPALLTQLGPHFRHAGQVLDTVPDNPISHWPDRVRVLPRRLLFVGIALLLRNVWVWVHWHDLATPRRGGRKLHLECLPFKMLLMRLARLAEQTFGVNEQIVIEPLG